MDLEFRKEGSSQVPLILELLHEISVYTQFFEEFNHLDFLALVDQLIVV